MTIIIETERLTLKTSSRENFLQVYQLLSDPDVMRYIGNGPKTENEVSDGLEKMIKHHEKHGFAFGDIYLKNSDEYIGRAGLIYLAMNDNQEEIEVGYQLHTKYWGQGYATEITIALIKWGFEHLQLKQIVAVIQPENQLSQRVLEKSGLNYVGKTAYYGREVSKFRIIKAIPVMIASKTT